MEAEFEKIDKKTFLNTYWVGKQNLAIRWWVYLLRGLNMLNEFKYVLAAIISGYVILKITEPIWMVIVGVSVVPPLIILGRWQLQRASKVEQYISTELGNVLKWKDYEVKVETLNKLNEILEEIKNYAISVGSSKALPMDETPEVSTRVDK